MWIKVLELTNFRNYGQKRLEFDQATTVLVGPNAAGKTNILEAIYLLATGDSFRAEKIEEMVKWGEEVAHISGEVSTSPEEPITKHQKPNNIQLPITNDQKTQLQVTLTRGEVQGQKTAKRSFKINGTAKRKQDFVGQLTAVIFRPEDLEIVTDSPSRRRRWLDGILIQTDREYRRSLVSYDKGLRRRNRLLTLIREGEVPRTVLTFWDQLLIKEGSLITEKRRELIDFINTAEILERPRLIEYDFSAISEARLKQYEREEVAAGYTLVGPHKDDFKVLMEEKDLARYGSRGEQRMGVLWLKLNELAWIDRVMGERPVLLLDDIFSELDEPHDQLVLGLLGQQQTVITTTEVGGKFEGMDVLVIKENNAP